MTLRQIQVCDQILQTNYLILNTKLTHQKISVPVRTLSGRPLLYHPRAALLPLSRSTSERRSGAAMNDFGLLEVRFLLNENIRTHEPEFVPVRIRLALGMSFRNHAIGDLVGA